MLSKDFKVMHPHHIVIVGLVVVVQQLQHFELNPCLMGELLFVADYF
jgi:hypothetical protein